MLFLFQAHVRIWDGLKLSTYAVIGIGVFQQGISCLSFSESDVSYAPPPNSPTPSVLFLLSSPFIRVLSARSGFSQSSSCLYAQYCAVVVHLAVYRNVMFRADSELRSCVKVEVAVLGSPSLIVLTFSVDIKQH